VAFSEKKDVNTDKLASNWQNFVRVRLQFKFAFIIRSLVLIQNLEIERIVRSNNQGEMKISENCRGGLKEGGME